MLTFHVTCIWSPDITEADGMAAAANRVLSPPAVPSQWRPVQLMVAVVLLVHEATTWKAVAFTTDTVPDALASPPVVNSFGSLVHVTDGVVSLDRATYLTIVAVWLAKPRMLRTNFAPMLVIRLWVV